MLMRIMLTLALGCGCWLAMPARAVAAAEEPGQLSQHSGTGEHATDVGHDKPGLLPDPTSKETWLQALWTVIIFVVLLAILYPTAWKSVLAGLKAREKRIRQDIAEAEAARKRAEETLREYNARLAAAEQSVRELLAKATSDGERVATTIRMQAQQEAEQIKERATRDIEAARDAAVRQVREEAVLLATSMAEKILRRNLNPDDQRELVRGSLEELQTIAK
jgi:F-type H+-transporting ATPase subunit b